MRKIISLMVLLALIVAPLASADVIVPGEKIIYIENKITNLADYSGYVFIAIPFMGENICPVSEGIEQIGTDGKIFTVYKFCTVSVYAFNNSNFDKAYLNELYANVKGEWKNATAFNDYLSQNGKKVIEGIKTSESVSDVDSRESVSKEYSIDPNILKSEADKVVVKRNYLIYVYIIAPIVALALIIFFLIKRRK